MKVLKYLDLILMIVGAILLSLFDGIKSPFCVGCKHYYFLFNKSFFTFVGYIGFLLFILGFILLFFFELFVRYEPTEQDIKEFEEKEAKWKKQSSLVQVQQGLQQPMNL